jgi:predicted RNase H-like nuclease
MRESEMRVVGIDGCRSGWVAVVLRGGHFEAAFLERRLYEVLEHVRDAAVAAVDIPIGSEPDKFRRVDIAAKKFLGPRHNSVFLMPPLEVFRLASYAEACARCRELAASAPSKQVWELREKILEADEVAASDGRIIEVHPEVSFRALVGAPLTYGKKTWAGQGLRRAALGRAGIEIPNDLGAAGAAAPDDVLDAAIAAWSANRHARAATRSLDPRFVDAAGRTITIWY